jgi:hypothetical protein
MNHPLTKTLVAYSGRPWPAMVKDDGDVARVDEDVALVVGVLRGWCINFVSFTPNQAP